MTGSIPTLRSAVVTGATGLLGNNIVRQLLAHGCEVTAIVRDKERARRLLPASDGLRVVVGDVTQLNGFAFALRGAEAVFHTAAYFREYYQPGYDPGLLHRTNVQAVLDLLQAALDAAVPVVVHTSSVGTLGTGPDADSSLADENSRLNGRGTRNAYFASKVRADEAVHAFCERHTLRVPVILPSWMWGPHDAGPTSAGRLFLAVARGELRAVPRAGNHVVDARDVASACIRAAVRGSGRYVVGGVWRTLPDVCGAVARTVGVAAPRAVPARAALTATSILELQARLRRRPPVATRKGLQALLEGNRRRVSSARAQSDLGVSFRPLEETMEDEAAWYRDQAMLSGHIR